MKFKELVKTIILTGLVICSLVLSAKIWFSKELWPDGYNSFNYAQNSNIFSKIFSIFDNESGKALELSQIFSPKQILVTKDSRNQLILPDNDRSEDLENRLKENLKAVILNGKFSESNEEEYKKAAKSSSVFVDFYNYISFEMLADYYGVSVNSSILEIYNIKHILFSMEESGIKLYAKNNKNGKIYKSDIIPADKELASLCDSILKRVPEGTVASSFAYENNFDKRNENEPAKLLLNSYMLINLNTSEISQIKPVLLMNTDDFDISLYNSIVNHFGIKLSSARRYTDSVGNVNLIENFATLKFNRDGLFEYDCLNANEGIEIAGNIATDYGIVKAAGEFTEILNKNFSLPDKNKYIFSGVEEDAETGNYTVYFDILYNGVPVILKRDISEKELPSHAIEVEISNGRIVSYTQMLCGFTNAGSKSQISPMITALDKFYTSYDIASNPDAVINDIYTIYHFDPQEQKVEAKCAVSLSNKDIVIVKP